MKQNEVYVTHAANYEDAGVLAAVRRHFAHFSLAERLSADTKVLIKPNLLLKRKPEEATTTHPAVVEAVVRCLQEIGVRHIVIADSPGGPYTRAYLDPIYETTGMRAVAERTGASLYRDCKSFEKEVENPVMCSGFTLIEPFAEADFIIDLPKLKTHGMMTLSGGVKNMFGSIPGLMKPEMHWRYPEKEPFTEMLLDLCETVRPDFVLCDGIVSMEGDGPSGGSPKETGMLLSSDSPYALDVALCDVVGLAPNEVSTVAQAAKRGLSPAGMESVVCAGDPLSHFSDFKMPRSKSVDFSQRIPKPFRGAVNRLLTSRPVIQKSQCIGCGKCAESCPPKTITVADRKAKIDPSRCIHCFCCHEMCPVRAIKIRRFGLFDF